MELFYLNLLPTETVTIQQNPTFEKIKETKQERKKKMERERPSNLQCLRLITSFLVSLGLFLLLLPLLLLILLAPFCSFFAGGFSGR